MKPDDFIAMLATAAQASAKTSGIPASFTLAQAALESGWGTSKTAVNARNLFNIKADSSWHGPWWAMASTEHVGTKDVLQAARWRLYHDWQACLDDRAKFFKTNPRYAACFKAIGGDGWARAVAAAGYATDPDYADKLISTMRSHDMQRYDEPVVVAVPSAVMPDADAIPAAAPTKSTGFLSVIFGLIGAIFGKRDTK